ncbi:hypothetical protein D9758_014560 [Tetrapyrgos nigripes]|uniref:Uncharacterized protein n=1 Tax=Tetrapyrgos nigripes TaxID=182062 RepID=A0A8H5CGT1_9AGAR|nr:hypothetical protein D9758_014560 [Tetrapyrgos nigripes]
MTGPQKKGEPATPAAVDIAYAVQWSQSLPPLSPVPVSLLISLLPPSTVHPFILSTFTTTNTPYHAHISLLFKPFYLHSIPHPLSQSHLFPTVTCVNYAMHSLTSGSRRIYLAAVDVNAGGYSFSLSSNRLSSIPNFAISSLNIIVSPFIVSASIISRLTSSSAARRASRSSRVLASATTISFFDPFKTSDEGFRFLHAGFERFEDEPPLVRVCVGLDGHGHG